jgi:hypothetical protein
MYISVTDKQNGGVMDGADYRQQQELEEQQVFF